MSEEYSYTKTDAIAVFCAIAVFLLVTYMVTTFHIPGSPEILFVYVPIAMGAMPLLFCICLMTQASRRRKRKGPDILRYRGDTVVYTGDYEIHSESKAQEKEKVYLIPAQCPSCNSSLSKDIVEWTGPLQAKCPFCDALVEAEEKTF